MLKRLKLRIKNNKMFLFDEETGLLAEANSYDDALQVLKKKTEDYKKLVNKSGLKPMILNSEFEVKESTSYLKKWIIAFFFISLISVPVSYSISIGIKNGVNSIQIPKGNKIWQDIGDSIIKSAQSDSIKDTTREEQIKNSLSIIKKRIQPYIDFFSSESCSDLQLDDN